MYDPQSISPGSIMPRFPWIIEDDYSISDIGAKIKAMQFMGVPYPKGYDLIADKDINTQATDISNDLKNSGIEVSPKKEIIALTAYLQRLGIDIKGKNNVQSDIKLQSLSK